MRFFVVAVVAVLATGAKVQAQNYDNILIRWSPSEIDEPFWPEARDDKGEILWKYGDEFSAVWTSVADEAYNNHYTRQWAVGEFEYWMSNRTPPPVEDGPTVGGTLHHYDGTLDFHSGRRYTASGSVTQSWNPEDWGILQIPLLADHEGHELKINGESVFQTEIGERFSGDVYAFVAGFARRGVGVAFAEYPVLEIERLEFSRVVNGCGHADYLERAFRCAAILNKPLFH